MEEVIKVSVASVGFILTNKSYELLKEYLDKLEQFYKSNPDRDEIIDDIEARIAEIILERHAPDSVVSEETIKDVIFQLGEPEQIEQELGSDGENNRYRRSGGDGRNFPRRLYRNMDGAKLGGVCNGFASYFEIDPTMVRLIFITPLILKILFEVMNIGYLEGFLGSLAGASLLIYVILWIVIPKAKTPRQRLEMKGERITASSIDRGSKEEESGSESRIRSSFATIGSILLVLIKIFCIILGFSLALVVMGLFIAMVAIMIGGLSIINMGVTTIFDGFTGVVSPTMFVVLAIAVVIIPLIVITYQFFRIGMNAKNSRAFMWSMTGLWVLGLVFLGVATVNNRAVLEKNTKSEFVYEKAVEKAIEQSVKEMIEFEDGELIIDLKLDGLSGEMVESEIRREFREHIEKMERGEITEKEVIAEVKEGLKASDGQFRIIVVRDVDGKPDSVEIGRVTR